MSDLEPTPVVPAPVTPETTTKEVTTPPSPPPPVTPETSTKDVTEEKEKAVVPVEKVDDSKALAIVETDSSEVKSGGGSIDRDIALTRVETEKRLSLIRAWEESEKSKAENKASKKLSDVGSWENTKKAAIEAQLKEIEEKLEKKKALYAEKMKNKIAMLHKEAEERRAMVEAKKGEDLLKAEEMAAKYRATGSTPKKLLGCF